MHLKDHELDEDAPDGGDEAAIKAPGQPSLSKGRAKAFEYRPPEGSGLPAGRQVP